MQRLALLQSQLKKNDTFRKGESRVETMLIQNYPHYSVVKFNRPKYMNSINVNMLTWINRFVDFWNSNPNIKVCIWKGDGVAFCAGGDLVLWREISERKDYEAFALMSTFCYQTLARIKNMNPIQISIWNGFVMGGGVGFSIHSEIRIATESTVFAMPEAAVGYVPDSGSTVYLARLRNNLGLYYALTGAKIMGDQLCSLGLADYFVPLDRLEELEKALGEAIDEDISLDRLKKIVEKYHVPKIDTKIEHEEIIKEAFGGKTLHEVFERLTKLSKTSEFALKTLKTFHRYPPRGLRVIFEQYSRAKNMDINQGLDMDYSLARFMTENDFAEAVEALFLKTGKKPEWTDKSIDIPDDVIKKYFEPISEDFRKIDFATYK